MFYYNVSCIRLTFMQPQSQNYHSLGLDQTNTFQLFRQIFALNQSYKDDLELCSAVLNLQKQNLLSLLLQLCLDHYSQRNLDFHLH